MNETRCARRSTAVYNFANPQAPAPPDFTYTTWQQAWPQAANLAQTERLALFIDAFTYVLEIDPSAAGVLQNMWDHVLKQSNLFLNTRPTNGWQSTPC